MTYNPNHAEAASKAHEQLCAIECAKEPEQCSVCLVEADDMFTGVCGHLVCDDCVKLCEACDEPICPECNVRVNAFDCCGDGDCHSELEKR